MQGRLSLETLSTSQLEQVLQDRNVSASIVKVVLDQPITGMLRAEFFISVSS